jgi:spore coat polysaccharide biosynthesis protein SpsF (cytidylyltransferase family)
MTAGRALVVLQARMGSTRLPGKVLADVAGTTVLERCVRRLQAPEVGPVVVATTVLPADDAIAALAVRLGAGVVRGAVDDVLGRYIQAAVSWAGPFVLRATADNPLVDPEASVRVLEYLRQGADYVAEKGLPVGAAVEGMTTAALRRAGLDASDAYDREHVTPWLRRGVGLDTREPAAPAGLQHPDLRFTIDTAADLAHVRRLVAAAGPDPLLPLTTFIRTALHMSPAAGANDGAVAGGADGNAAGARAARRARRAGRDQA